MAPGSRERFSGSAAISERVQSQAFMRAALNLGFTLGALISGIALAFESNTLVRAVPVFTAIVLALNALYITQLPDAEHDVAPVPPGEQKARGEPPVTRRHVLSPFCCSPPAAPPQASSVSVVGTASADPPLLAEA